MDDSLRSACCAEQQYFYNGTGINDFAANKARTPWQHSYVPGVLFNGSAGISTAAHPINVYFNASLKI
jgi:hypothetical protein